MTVQYSLCPQTRLLKRIASSLTDVRGQPSTSIQPLQEALLDQPFHIGEPHVELAVLCQVDGAILGLDLAGIAQHAHVDEQIPRRHQRARQVDVGPLALVRREQIRVLAEILLFLGRQRAVGRGGLCLSLVIGIIVAILQVLLILLLLLLLGGGVVVEQVFPLPAPRLDPLGAHAVVRQQTALVAAHAQVVDEQCTCRRRVLGPVERVLRLRGAILVRHAAAEWREDVGHIPVEVAHFAHARSHEFRLVWWERRQG